MHGRRLKRRLLNQYCIVGISVSVTRLSQGKAWNSLEVAHGRAWSCHLLQRNCIRPKYALFESLSGLGKIRSFAENYGNFSGKSGRVSLPDHARQAGTVNPFLGPCCSGACWSCQRPFLCHPSRRCLLNGSMLLCSCKIVLLDSATSWRNSATPMSSKDALSPPCPGPSRSFRLENSSLAWAIKTRAGFASVNNWILVASHFNILDSGPARYLEGCTDMIPHHRQSQLGPELCP